MKLLESEGPIIACASGGQALAGVHLIRLSGFESLEIFKDYFSISVDKIKPRYHHLIDLKNSQKELLDQCMMSFFKAPHSFTGEHVLELGVHGNPLNVERIINFFVEELGFKKALPGEFSFRALKNGKLSLSQVEGLDLFLNAQNVFSLKQGLSLLEGPLQDFYSSLYQKYLKHKASLELMIDFAEDIGEEQGSLELQNSFLELEEIIGKLYQRTTQRGASLVRPKVVLLGATNAGKSTLFNLLLGEDRAITSNIRGTTRDFLTESFRVEGMVFELIDTAGLRQTEDAIEKEGIAKAKKLIENAFYKILLINPEDPQEDQFQHIDFDGVIYSHQSKFGPMGPPESIKTNWSYGTNLLEKSAVIELIRQKVLSKFQELSSSNPLVLDRHVDSIRELFEKARSYKALIESCEDIAIIDSELQALGQGVSELVGVVAPDQVLESVFSNFCIGK
ncbi:MAG: GTP-binding protein [Halobacteriovoraceae bacterium]|nr:GTP-binding protein [Halobacteriovoraceae bacterium]